MSAGPPVIGMSRALMVDDELHMRRQEWAGIGVHPTLIPPSIGQTDLYTRNLDMITLQREGRDVLKSIPKWTAISSRTDPRSKPKRRTRKQISMEDRNPAGSAEDNVNYVDLRKLDETLGGPNVLYRPDDDRPLEEDERKRAGLVTKNGKVAKLPALPAKYLIENPVKNLPIEDTWTNQGVSYYGFMIGGRYNRSDNYDELIYRDYGVFLSRENLGRVFFSKPVPLDIRAGSADSTRHLTTPLTSQLRFHIPVSNRSSMQENRATASASQHSASTTVGPSVASSAYYYKSNDKSVRALMDRLAGTMRTPKRGFMHNHNEQEVPISSYPVTNPPRTIVKGGQGGRSFAFSQRNLKPHMIGRPEMKKSNPKIEQLVSLGYQLARSQYDSN